MATATKKRFTDKLEAFKYLINLENTPYFEIYIPPMKNKREYKPEFTKKYSGRFTNQEIGKRKNTQEIIENCRIDKKEVGYTEEEAEALISQVINKVREENKK